MGTALSKVELLQGETKILQQDLSELKKERDAAREKAEALEKELRDQREIIRGLDAFATETKETLLKLDREMDRVWDKVFK